MTADPVDIDGDGDGDLDVLMSAGDGYLLSWMENDGSSPPSWSFYSIYAGTSDESAWGATAFDVEGDGDIDVFANINCGGNYHIWCMLNDGGSPPSWDLFEVADDQAVYYDMDGADIDDDGKTDLVVAETWGSGLFWLKNIGTGSGWNFSNIGWMYDANSVCTGDFDLDGDIDVAGTTMNEYESGILWFESDGSHSGLEWEEHVVSELPSTSLSAGDLDGDGDQDVALGTFAGLFWYENGPSGWTEHEVKSGFCGKVKIADIDSDGDADLAAVFNDDVLEYYIAWMENLDGIGESWDEHLITLAANEVDGMAVADMDGDLAPDVVATPRPNWVNWYANPGSAGAEWTEHWVVDIDQPMGLAVADMDGDGDLDIPVVHLAGTWVVSWVEKIAPDTWDYHLIQQYYTSQSYRSTVIAEDYDQDGDLDIAAMGLPIDSFPALVWLENIDGEAYGWLSHDITWGDYGNYLGNFCSSDFDGDGYPDIAGANLDGTRWLSLLHYPDESWLESSLLDTGVEAEWGMIDWTSTEPGASGTDVSFRVRSSEDGDPTNLGPWSDPIHQPDSLSGILTDGHRYVQYKATLASLNGDSTPALHDVTISWTQESVASSRQAAGGAWLRCASSPARGAAVLRWRLPGGAAGRLRVFDLAGRCVYRGPADAAEGIGTLTLNRLPSGVYTARITSGGLALTERFVLLE